MQHFKPVISNDASLSGNSFSIIASHGLAAPNVAGHRCLSPLMHKAKDMAETSLVVRDGNGNRNSLFQRLGSFEDTTCIKEYGRLIGEKPSTVRVSLPGNEYDRSASNTVMQLKYATE